MAEVEVLGLHLLLHANRIQIRRPPVGDQHERHIKRRKRVSSSLTDLLGEVRFQRKALKVIWLLLLIISWQLTTARFSVSSKASYTATNVRPLSVSTHCIRVTAVSFRTCAFIQICKILTVGSFASRVTKRLQKLKPSQSWNFTNTVSAISFKTS